MRVFVILDDRTSLEHPLGEAVDVLASQEDAERFIAELRGVDAEFASHLRIEESELDAGGLSGIPASRSLRRQGMCAEANCRTDLNDAARGVWLGASRPNGRGYGGRARVPASQQGSANGAAQT